MKNASVAYAPMGGADLSGITCRFERNTQSDQAHYDYRIIILGNLTNYTDEQIKRIIDNSDYEIFDFNRTYKELVFPLCSGTYYDPKEIIITINLEKKDKPVLKQEVSTNLGTFPIKVIFVPTKEIGRIMEKYKNSILKYNPRNFLSLSNNRVNPKIRASIVDNNTNNFAIYNNGITMIADSFDITERTGIMNIGQIIMKNPQIINGGQTAYVLSKIYEEQQDGDYSIFDGKEVMLKVIVLTGAPDLKIDFIEQISNATNQQTKIDEADRRSNNKIQIAIESAIFEQYGYFYERKKGEYYNGIDKRYINKSLVINRNELVQAYLAWQGDAANARRSGSDAMFKEKRFKEIMNNLNEVPIMFFAYNLLKVLESSEKISADYKFGPNLKYGKMAIISAAGIFGVDKEKITTDSVNSLTQDMIQKISSTWDDFIKYVLTKKDNNSYIRDGNLDYDTYYKGSTVNEDIRSFFKEKRKTQ